MFSFDENGVLIPGSQQGVGMGQLGYGMSPDVNAVPPIPSAAVPAMSTPMSPNLEQDPVTANALAAALKKAGNLTPDQLRAISQIGASGNRAPQIGAPSAPLAAPRGVQGSMQQLGMAAPRERKTLAQLLYR